MSNKSSIHPKKIFISYSHKDEEYRIELEKHLANLIDQELIETWHDRRIPPGSEWPDVIDQNLEEANIILLLLSADFIASHYCYKKEMTKALERHEARDAIVIPIFVRPYDWQGAPIAKLQGLPKDAIPVTKWVNRDEAWTDVAKGIRAILESEKPIDSFHSHLSSNFSTYEGLKTDWGDSPDVSIFYGRKSELDLLKRWIIEKRCRMVAILGMAGIGKTWLSIKLGMGGIGKTDLSIKLAKGLQEENFDFVIWRRLLGPPKFEIILTDCIKLFSNHQEIDLPNSTDEQISRLLYYLKKYRCLIILDNFETVIKGRTNDQRYHKGSEAYGELLKRVGETKHKSCLLLTSREKPKEITSLEGKSAEVRSLSLYGLDISAGKKKFENVGVFSGTNEEWKDVIEFYNGNPLALDLAAKHINTVFSGSLTEFLKEGKQVFNTLNDLLNWHFKRLSDSEREIMYWLAINLDSTSISDLREDILFQIDKDQVFDILESIQKKITIEKNKNGYSLQPVLIEFITDHIVDHIYKEIITRKIKLFICLALFKAQAKDFVRSSQTSMILVPIIKRLNSNIEDYLFQILLDLRETSTIHAGYAGGNILNILCKLYEDSSFYPKKSLRDYDFSNIPIRQAYLQNIELHDVNFTNSDLSKSVFAEIFGNIRSIAFSSTEKCLATGGVDSQVHLWEIPNIKQLHIFSGHTGAVLSVAYSPDGKIIASGSSDQTIRLWDIPARKCRILRGHESWVMAIAFSKDGKILASGSADSTIILWNVDKGSKLHCLKGHKDRVCTLAFSSEILASGSEDNTIKFWDFKNGKRLNTIESAHKERVFSIAFSPNGSKLVSGGGDNLVKLWNIKGSIGECIHTLEGHTDRVRGVAFSPKDYIIASCGQDKNIRLWNTTGQPIKTLIGHGNRIRSVAFSPDGETIASVGDDQTLRLWQTSTGHLLESLLGYTNQVKSIALSHDANWLVSGSEDRTLRFWDMTTKKCINNLKGHTGGIWAVAFSNDNKWIASGSDDQTVRIWEINSQKRIEKFKTLQEHTHRIWSVAFSPDSKFLVTACEDERIRVWDTETWQRVQILHQPEGGHENGVLTIKFNHNGSLLASGGDDKFIKIWNVKDWRCVKTMKAHADRVENVAFNIDGSLLASGSADKTVCLWDIESFKCIKIFNNFDCRVSFVAFSPDNKVAVGSNDGTIRLWDYQNEMSIKTLISHKSKITSLIFDPVEDILISSSEDDTIKLWDYENENCIQTLNGDRIYERMNITGVRGLSGTQKATLKFLGALEY